ncbi:MAG: sigma-54-dependent Fis family transcriptional regulator [Leptospiraceae bacterium]|nr:sigma-54-dependent Fis family transcriptional regulator [Leptospiraceae bacterium]
MNTAVLIIEDNDAQRAALEEFVNGIKEIQATVYAAPDGEIAQSVLSDRQIDLVLSDLMLPDTTGIELVKIIKKRNSQIPVIMMTGQPAVETAIAAIREGADDYLVKPVDLIHLKKKILNLLENRRLRTENQQLRERLQNEFQVNNIIGSSEGLRRVLEKCRQVAPTDVTVLIEGESGTGKELIANLLHENSPRSNKPFVTVNCGAITKTLLESELFGVVKGAYTGADKSRPGYFETANGGTIFLDEIGEMDLESQVRLLRVLEEREVMRIGSSQTIPVDVRIIAATNRHLLDSIDAAEFREDLYYRLSVIRLELPPLRERSSDIPLLFNHMIVGLNDKYGKSVRGLSDELRQFMSAYDWPGNIRQFRNVLEGMVVLATDDILQKNDLPPELLAGSKARQQNAEKLMHQIIPNLKLADYEKLIIARNLALQSGNREKTAAVLGISERTLYRKIKEYDLN